MICRKVYSTPPRYYIDGKQVSEKEYAAAVPEKDGFCTNFLASSLASWSSENNGRGRYIGQLADKVDDPKAYCKSVDHAMEKAKRRGFEAKRLS